MSLSIFEKRFLVDFRKGVLGVMQIGFIKRKEQKERFKTSLFSLTVFEDIRTRDLQADSAHEVLVT